MLSVGRESGAVRAVLEVRASNVAARSLYERVGFRQVALRRRYYTDPVEDAVLLGMEPLQEYSPSLPREPMRADVARMRSEAAP